jgi:dolichyl-phosphate beta-glucosyltransferase
MSADLALVIPAFNEAVRLPRALDMLAAYARESGLSLQVVVADDGSTDGTPELARRWAHASSDPHLRVEVVTIRHRGKGAAVRAGMRHLDAPVVGYCDADLSAGPDAIAQLRTLVLDGADMVMGSRGLPASILEIRQPFYRERAGKVFNFLLRKLAAVPYRDTQCGLKLFRQQVARDIFRHQRLDGFAFDAEVVVLALRLGFTVDEVPIRWAHSGQSKVSMLTDPLRMARDIVRVVRRLGRGTLHAPGLPGASAAHLMATSEEAQWWNVGNRRAVQGVLASESARGPLLDVGCGGGAMLAEAPSPGEAVGVDLAPGALRHARARGVRNLAAADAAALPFASASFATVLALDVLEHHPRPEEMLAEIRRVLRPGGLLIATVPAFPALWSFADHVLGRYRRYTKPGLERELCAASLEPSRVTYLHSWPVPFVWAFRKLRAVGRLENHGAVTRLSPVLDALLLEMTKPELRLLRRRDLPFGLFLMAVARSGPAASQGHASPSHDATDASSRLSAATSGSLDGSPSPSRFSSSQGSLTRS